MAENRARSTLPERHPPPNVALALFFAMFAGGSDIRSLLAQDGPEKPPRVVAEPEDQKQVPADLPELDDLPPDHPAREFWKNLSAQLKTFTLPADAGPVITLVAYDPMEARKIQEKVGPALPKTTLRDKDGNVKVPVNGPLGGMAGVVKLQENEGQGGHTLVFELVDFKKAILKFNFDKENASRGFSLASFNGTNFGTLSLDVLDANGKRIAELVMKDGKASCSLLQGTAFPLSFVLKGREKLTKPRQVIPHLSGIDALPVSDPLRLQWRMACEKAHAATFPLTDATRNYQFGDHRTPEDIAANVVQEKYPIRDDIVREGDEPHILHIPYSETHLSFLVSVSEPRAGRRHIDVSVTATGPAEVYALVTARKQLDRVLYSDSNGGAATTYRCSPIGQCRFDVLDADGKEIASGSLSANGTGTVMITADAKGPLSIRLVEAVGKIEPAPKPVGMDRLQGSDTGIGSLAPPVKAVGSTHHDEYWRMLHRGSVIQSARSSPFTGVRSQLLSHRRVAGKR